MANDTGPVKFIFSNTVLDALSRAGFRMCEFAVAVSLCDVLYFQDFGEIWEGEI